ncbi:Mitosis inhibitor protein kinase wee1 [Dictyocoela muelleri]|nr:Mitosis inhibitor protein kinase wee1 [Dictyocoela muelleri]
MDNDKTYFHKSTFSESITNTPKTPRKSNPTSFYKIKSAPPSKNPLKNNFDKNLLNNIIFEKNTEKNELFKSQLIFENEEIEVDDNFFLDNFSIIRKVGCGDFSDVYLARNKFYKNFYANFYYEDCNKDLIKKKIIHLMTDDKYKDFNNDDFNNINIVKDNNLNNNNNNNNVNKDFNNDDNKNNYSCKNPLCCIKISTLKYRGAKHRQHILRETKILYKIKNHPNILKIHKAFEISGFLHIEADFCDLGNLRDAIDLVYFEKKSRFRKDVIRKFMRDISAGLYFLENQNIIHCDLKPSNILLKSVGNVNRIVNHKDDFNDFKNDKNDFKNDRDDSDDYSFTFVIADFNISRYIFEQIDTDGDKKYMPPEVLKNQWGPFVDIFSLGLIFLELKLEIILPTFGDSWMRLRQDDFKDLNFEMIESDELIILKRMVSSDFTLRPRAKDVYEFFVNKEKR